MDTTKTETLREFRYEDNFTELPGEVAADLEATLTDTTGVLAFQMLLEDSGKTLDPANNISTDCAKAT